MRTTIIIPTYNRCELLPRAIGSALAQTVPCEVLVVDHGSTDGTPLVAQGFGNQIRYLRREDDFGPVVCWIDGVVNATTELVKFLYDDDFLEPDYLEKCEPLLTGEVGFAMSAVSLVNLDNGKTLEHMFTFPGARSGRYPIKSDLGRKLEKAMISPGAILLRREDALDSLYPGRLPFQKYTYHGAGADHFVKLNLYLKYEYFGFVPEPLAHFGNHPGSITINAFESESKRRSLRRTYRDVWAFYRFLKFGRPLYFVFRFPSVTRLIGRILNQIFARFRRRPV